MRLRGHESAGLAGNGMTRRTVMLTGAAALFGVASSPALAAIRPPRERSLALHNLHTGETIRTTFWADGRFLTDALRDIDFVLRDFRTGDVTEIDPELLVLLHRLSQTVEVAGPFHVISGYRSPKTNAALAKASNGVAKRSLHMQGMAIDVRLPGLRLKHLRDAAVTLQGGGVGYYPKSDFIHLDTGRVRFW